MSNAGRTVDFHPIESLKLAPQNPRIHSEKQIALIAKSIERFGFTNPLLIDENRSVVAGHGRLAAAKKLGWHEVPCLKLSNMSEADKRAYIIADNKLAERAGWDRSILAAEFEFLVENKFDLSLTGFELAESDIIMSEEAHADPASTLDRDDQIPAAVEIAVTKKGDLWELDRHLLLCDDARDPTSFEHLLGGAKVDMIFADPPYNVPINGHVSGLGQTQHREFVVASGEMAPDEFVRFLTEIFGNSVKVSRDGAIAFVCMDWRHLGEILKAGEACFTELKNLCVWAKTNGGMGTFYRSKHELVFVWKVGTAPHTNTFGLGDKGRYRTNVWTYPGVNTFKSERMEEIASHPTVKPVTLVADAIRDVTHRGELILDPFGGSGTTLMAAHRTGRSARLLEIDPIYCDVTIRRFEKATGKKARHVGSNRAFSEIESSRSEENLGKTTSHSSAPWNPVENKGVWK